MTVNIGYKWSYIRYQLQYQQNHAPKRDTPNKLGAGLDGRLTSRQSDVQNSEAKGIERFLSVVYLERDLAL